MKKDVGRRTGDANTQIDFKLMKIHIDTKSTQTLNSETLPGIVKWPNLVDIERDTISCFVVMVNCICSH